MAWFRNENGASLHSSEFKSNKDQMEHEDAVWAARSARAKGEIDGNEMNRRISESREATHRRS